MNVQFLNPFVEAAFAVLEAEASLKAQRGQISLQRSAATSDDITVLISMVGQVQGVVLYSLSERTAIAIVSKIMDQPFEEFDELAQSGIGEIGNVITGQAGNRLSQVGYNVNISPPTMIMGKGTLISTLDFERIKVPILTEFGAIQLDIALREKEGLPERVAQTAMAQGGA